ncbi:GntR family transcriptional regulator [Enterococcus rivorum]|uniref:HTH gntR-type domain-containing protein n=1 Tax=Enterococcus rivorum TaxID=762845 RepID=A0A1E5KV63_9ENTE|nr:GntR family transcriptional regulator [Enterococcus rivorum]MBP2100392.1 GntR family transcriptional regulator [Enterococcus rivorum]OEH81774.1 hypothetical protein BCR26_15515 [Enterococcus rivorum]
MNHMNLEKQTLADLTYELLKNEIEKGHLKPGEKLSSEVQLSKEINVSRPILREALLRLANDGYINRKHGIGTFVAKNAIKLEPGLERLDSITDFVTENDYKIETKIIKKLEPVEDTKIKASLNMNLNEKLYGLERVRYMENVPFTLDFLYIPEQYIDLADFDTYKKQSILAYFIARCKINIVTSNCTIYAENAAEEIAEILEIEAGVAIQILEQLFYDEENSPIFYGKSFMLNDFMKFRVVRRR